MAKKSYSAPAAEHALGIIKLLSGSTKPLNLTEICTELAINKNMAFRVLNTLQENRWVCAVEPGPRYRMTLVPFQITSQPVARLGVREMARSHLIRLWEDLGESTYLGILHETEVLLVEHFESMQDVHVEGRIGGLYPLHCSAPGKVLLAYSLNGLFKKLTKKKLKAYTDKTITDSEKLKKHMEEVKEQGYALDDEEHGRGIICCAAPVFDHTGKAAASVGITAATINWTVDKFVDTCIPRVVKAAKEISVHMGNI